MRRYILDTNALGHFINHLHGVDDRVRRHRRAGDRIGTCVPVIGELYFGLELSASRDENLKRADRAIRGLTIWPFDHEVGREFGRIRAVLRRAGRAMQVVDLQLAAIALTLGNCIVVSADSDLAAVPGLAVENWATS